MTRVFPAPKGDLYSLGAPDADAEALLRLADRSPPAVQRLMRRTPKGEAGVALALNLHKRAVAAESEGNGVAAELLFAECVRVAQRLWATPEDLHIAMAKVASGEPGELAERLLREVFVDTSLAFANGGDETDPRVAQHLGHAAAFLQLSQAQDADTAALMEAVQRRRIEVLSKSGDRDEAARTACEAADLNPTSEYWARQSAALLQERLLVGVGAGQGPHVGAIERVLPSIWDQSRKHPRNLYLFDLLSTGQNLYAVGLANGNRLADSVRAAYTAMVCNPSNPYARETFDVISRRVDDLRAQMDQVQAQMRDNPNMRLSGEGEYLRAELGRATTAFGAIDKDERAKKAGRDRLVALGHYVWRNVTGESASHDGTGDARAAALLTLVEGAPKGLAQDGLLDHVREQLSARSELSGMSAEDVSAYVRRLDGENAEGARAPEETAPGRLKQDAIALPAATSRRGSEPLLDWWAAPRDAGVKVAASVAALVFVIGFATLSYDAVAATMRDRAYSELVAAAESGDAMAVGARARAFASWTPIGFDARVAQVESLAAVAADQERRVRRDAAMAALTASMEAGDLNATLLAAETFLAHVTPGVLDPREREVRGLYDRAFNAWVLNSDEQDAAAEAHIETYRRLSGVDG